jgi:hypothetical protein
LLLALVLGLLVVMATPSVALAGQSVSVSSAGGFPAGGDPTFTTTTSLDTGAGTPSLVTVRLAPGVLSSANANASCLSGAPQYTPVCQIGQGSAEITPGLPLSFNAYLVPPPSAADVAGIDLVTGLPQAVTHAGVQLTQTPSGNVQTVLQVDLSQLGDEAPFVTGMTLTVNGTLDGNPFNRMPTNCSPGPTTVTVVYANGAETTTASPDFAPSGCASLPYAPALSATAVKDPNDNGVAVSTVVTQAADDAASSATTLRLPWPTLGSNFGAAKLLDTTTPVGRASVTTPLLPQPLRGDIYFTGQLLSPTLTIRFPPPAAMTLIGTVDLSSNSVTFPALPDVPQTRLAVTLFGGPKSLLLASCANPSGTLEGTFTGQNGAVAHTRSRLVVEGCGALSPGLGVASASLSGLAAGRPALRLKLAGGKLRSFTIALRAALNLDRSALPNGVSVSGPHTLKVLGGRLHVTLLRATGSVMVRLTPPALRESGALRRRARHHAVRLKLSVTLTGAGGASTTRTVTV